MKKYKTRAAMLLILALLLSGCGINTSADADDPGANIGNSADLSDAELGDAPVYTDGDETPDASEDGSDAVASPDPLDTSITTADTSDMEFNFSQEDTTAATTSQSDATVNVSNAETTTVSAGELYNITSGGTYTLTGTKDMMLTVDAGDADVTLILDGLTISNTKGPAIYVKSAGKVTMTLNAGTVNTLSDGVSYSIEDGGSSLDAALFSRADLTINGSGKLTVKGNYKHGIVSKDDLIISSGVLQITSNKVGLNGKDCVKINGGTLTISAGSDGIRSDNEEDASKGYVYLYGGTINITAGNDGIQAETVVKVEDVALTVKAGGGSSAQLTSSDESYKGVKAGSDIYVTGGSFNIDSLDDCIHSNGTITISGGAYKLASGDDGIHADTDLAISGSATNLSISKSYEGIEATSIVISGGTISLVASDDGLNAAGGNDSSSTGARPGKGSFSASTGKIVISGGTLYIKASGDGIDANGSIDVTSGSITISGPNSGDTAILDYDTEALISGGTFIGTGASGMAVTFGSSSAQGVVSANVGTQSSGTVITLTDSNGKVLLTRTADQNFSYIILSCTGMTQGDDYTLNVGSATMTVTAGQSSGGMGGNMAPGGLGGGGNRGGRP